MKFQYKTFPALDILESCMINVEFMRYFPEDLVQHPYPHKDTSYNCPTFNEFRKKYISLTRDALKEARKNVMYITQTKMNDIFQSFDEETHIDDFVSFTAIWLNEHRVPYSMIFYETKEKTFMMQIIQQSAACIYVLDGDKFDAWQSKHFSEEEHNKIFATGMLLASEYYGYLKLEANVFGKMLKAKSALRLPNEIDRLENFSKTDITILN